MNTVCIVQARLGSTRFPRKVLADLCGKPLLSHVLERAATIHGVDRVMLAVPLHDVDELKPLWPNLYGGPEVDVLRRYRDCAVQVDARAIVRVTGDCPLLAPDLAERALKAYASTHGTAYVALCQPYCQMADGWDVEVFSRELLEEAHAKADASQREHVVTWMRENTIVARVPMLQDFSRMKLSVDTRADLSRVRRVMEFLNDPSDYSHAATWEAWQRAGRP